jgi:hypothetical protein
VYIFITHRIYSYIYVPGSLANEDESVYEISCQSRDLG